MKRIEVKPGDKHNELTIVREVESKGKRHVLCKCSCGNEATLRLDHVRSGHTTTCGNCGIVFQGKRKTLKEWADQYGIHESTLRYRLKRMDISEALKRGKAKDTDKERKS